MKRSAFLIHNPVAGQGNPQGELQQICDFLEPEFDLEIRLTTEEIGADRLAEMVGARCCSLAWLSVTPKRD